MTCVDKGAAAIYIEHTDRQTDRRADTRTQ